MAIDQDSEVWEGIYQSFSEVNYSSTVFEGTVWLDKVIDRVRVLSQAAIADVTINEVALTTDYALPYVVAMMANLGDELKILDFGGGLGTSYIPFTRMLHNKVNLDYVVIENKKLCETGRDFLIRINKFVFWNRYRRLNHFILSTMVVHCIMLMIGAAHSKHFPVPEQTI